MHLIIISYIPSSRCTLSGRTGGYLDDSLIKGKKKGGGESSYIYIKKPTSHNTIMSRLTWSCLQWVDQGDYGMDRGDYGMDRGDYGMKRGQCWATITTDLE